MDKIKPLTISNIASFGALLLSWVSILFLLDDKFYLSLGTMLLAFIADTLDGWLARKLKPESDFGRQLDGFVDIFIYLLYPSLVYYLHFKFQDLISVVILYIFIGAGVFRLVRFNIVGYIEKKFTKSYPGLPVFFSYLTLLLIFLGSSVLKESIFQVFALALILLQSVLMVCNFLVPKPKNSWPLVVILIMTSIYLFYLALT